MSYNWATDASRKRKAKQNEALRWSKHWAVLADDVVVVVVDAESALDEEQILEIFVPLSRPHR